MNYYSKNLLVWFVDNIETTLEFDPIANYFVTLRFPVPDVTQQQYEIFTLGSIIVFAKNLV